METYIPRALESVVLRYSQHFKAVLVTGPRQVGKTTMLKHLMERERERGVERAYVTMDNTALRLAAESDPALFLQRYGTPILIDEIQKAPELLPHLKILLDKTDELGLVWLTGSQPLHLMKHVSESLAGRVGIVEMLGLSQAEITGIPSVPFMPEPHYFKERVALREPVNVAALFETIFSGSFPGIRNLPEDLRSGGYESYLDTYIMRDIRDLSQVADESKFRRFIAAAAALTARPVVYSELARLADIDEKTAKSWLSLLVSTYLVKIVPPYANNLLKRLSKQPIMHFMDTGLAAYLTGWSNAQTLELGAMSGQIFETYAFDEIAKSFINAGKKPPIHFFRNNDKKEIDLLLEQNQTLYPVEVKKTASPTLSAAKNFHALNPVSRDDAPEGLDSMRRCIGTGTIVCMAEDALPLSKSVWAFPVWGI